MSLSYSTDLRLPLAAANRSRTADLALRAAVVLAASAFVAVCAHVSVPLPFTPIPFTLQPFAVLLVAMLLGPGMGFAALAAYLLEGAAGLPVFTPGVLQGVARLIGPSGGYLLAYPFAALLAGGLPRLLNRRFVGFVLGGVAAMLMIYTGGTLWFAQTLHVSFPSAFAGAVLPFAGVDAIKIVAAASMAFAAKRRVQRS